MVVNFSMFSYRSISKCVPIATMSHCVKLPSHLAATVQLNFVVPSNANLVLT
ncbi:hypothetical protein C3B55_00125 [Candidatus Pseudomonas adelgestsugas]|uniref:Uncharacterized protein n=1 Tax=Candidatus Pseudomonas adelgestsugas TaxID=1302376 RepID=A0ABX5R8I6_9PSED|nr:hypothetical protein C3B55_00125 [Candidatus Pseudomonas adelgestsugas]